MKQIIDMRHSIPFHRAKSITTSERFEILYTCTTTCCKNILKVSGPTPSRKPNYGIFKFSIFLVYSCFSNPETLDKIRIFSSSLWNFPYFSTFLVDSTLRIQNLKSEFTLMIVLTVNFCILPHCRTNFSFNLKRLMQKKLLLRIPLKFA